MHEVWIMEEKRPTVTMYSAYQAVKCGIHEPKYDGVQKQVCANTKKREAEKKMKTLGSLPVSVRWIVAVFVVGRCHSKRQQ